ncbi:aspartate ammonia-lyase [Bacteriovorax stolpii]|uniref:Aspartate ammonia-lyase n=1 Tax=Bacteriovorax stolpii TaxID=960 RepID=A0A2K9NVV9_BACTC|nr:aspartate ammonia-lyase [Bacteriovorax stolpii]AUN99663.1 aspartate ammonia-lyase [Bacteriovorax stolpii]QDK40340.1 aspartate ammonia-lyase [Bacteriovorax stolpii]TDP51295.1 aspartate ammonia-lyase [Bacteriovorax stolpii]
MSSQKDVRIEHDLLGDLAVPADAYYGIHTQRAIENFKISDSQIGHNHIMVKSLAITKKACALANGEIGTIDAKVAEIIARACDEIIIHGRCMDQFPSDIYQGGAGTSVNMNANEVIANLALELLGEKKGSYHIIHPNDHVNKCQSTNDAYPTAFRIALYRHITLLIEALESLCSSFAHKAEEFKPILKMGRTQLQDAVPMSLGQEFNAYATLLKEEVKLISKLKDLILEVNLGATAIGTGINAPEGYSRVAVKKLAEITGLEYTVSEDLIEATSDCGAYVMISGALKRTAVKLSKICNDLRLLSSGPRAGLKEINLPELQAGSSIMPAKVNPVIPEVVNQVCFKVIGNDLTVTMASEAGQLQLNVMEPVIASSLFESINLLENASYNLKYKCIDGITANPDICKNNVMNSIAIVTFLDPILGHEKCDLIGKECAKTGKTVSEVVLENKLLTQEQLDQIFSTENMLNPKYIGKNFKLQTL